MLRQPHESGRRRLRAGRIRSDALFESTFGATSAAMQQGLVAVAQTPSLNTYLTGTLGGTFEWRPIANTNRFSAHS